jgi:hypothetical protein
MSQKNQKRGAARRSKRLRITKKAKWEKILSDVDKTLVPVTCLEGIEVNLIDGTTVRIDIVQLLEEDGLDPDTVEDMINNRLEALDNIIRDVDFFINLDNVADSVQPLTDEILKNLK